MFRRKPLLLITILILLVSSGLFIALSARDTALYDDLPKPIVSGPISLSADPADYQIAYIVGDDFAEADDLLTSTDGLLAQTAKADVVTSWDALKALDAVSPVEALVVHPSAYADADFEWSAAAARRGMTTVVLDMYTVESATLRGSGCDLTNADRYPDKYKARGHHYFLAVSFMVRAEDPQNQLAAEDAAFNHCDQLDGTLSTGHGSQSMLLPDEEYAMSLVNVIMMHIDGARDFKLKAANPDMPPTPVPFDTLPTQSM